MAEHRSSVDIAAAPELVFEHLVTASGLAAWLGEWAQVEPEPGGEFRVLVAGYEARGVYLELDRPRRVMVSWGFAGSDTVPPGSSTVSFELSPTASGTRVELLHTDLPPDDVPGHAAGWAHFLPRLAITAAGGTPSPDTWKPTRPAQEQT